MSEVNLIERISVKGRIDVSVTPEVTEVVVKEPAKVKVTIEMSRVDALKLKSIYVNSSSVLNGGESTNTKAIYDLGMIVAKTVFYKSVDGEQS